MSSKHEPKEKKSAADLLQEMTTVTIEGKTYTLVMSHEVYIEAERLSGLSTITDAARFFVNPERRTLVPTFYALLKHAGAEYTLEQVAGMLKTNKNLKTIFQIVTSAYTLSQTPEGDASPTVAMAAS
jgi:hypothetical protein